MFFFLGDFSGLRISSKLCNIILRALFLLANSIFIRVLAGGHFFNFSSVVPPDPYDVPGKMSKIVRNGDLGSSKFRRTGWWYVNFSSLFLKLIDWVVLAIGSCEQVSAKSALMTLLGVLTLPRS